MPLAEWFDAIKDGVTAWDDVVTTPQITVVPSSITLDLALGEASFTATYLGSPVVGASMVVSSVLVATAVNAVTQAGGIGRLFPVAVGSTTLVIGPHQGVTKTIAVSVIDTRVVAPPGVVTSIKTGVIGPVYINSGPFEVTVLDQDDDPLPATGPDVRVEVDISKPGYLSAANASLTGVVMFYPRGVGVATVTFTYHDAFSGKLTLEKTIEVLP